MIKLTQAELNEKIKLHRMWIECEDGGERLCGVYDLSKLDLSGSDLRWSNLSGCDLGGSNLSGSNLSGSNLRGSDLSWSNLSGSNLRGSDLSWSNLSGSNLSGSNLGGSNLSEAKSAPFIPMSCPTHGEFIAWKKVNGKIIKLKIPEDAKRCSATTNKCRCDKAFVLAIENIDGTDSGLSEITNNSYTTCTYKVGEMVYPDSFDENRFNECSNGLHFFVDRGEAERW